MSERVASVAACCAVGVSIFSTVVSCSSQVDAERIKQDFLICNTKIESLNHILRNRFQEFDTSLQTLVTIALNAETGLYQAPTDPIKIDAARAAAAQMILLADRVWREARPYMTGARRDELKSLYEEKVRLGEIQSASQMKGTSTNAENNATIEAVVKFLLRSQMVVGDEIEFTANSLVCRVNDNPTKGVGVERAVSADAS